MLGWRRDGDGEVGLPERRWSEAGDTVLGTHRPASRQKGCWNARRSLVNTDESELALYRAERRVREIQTKLHRWARDDPHRRFDDLDTPGRKWARSPRCGVVSR